MQVGITGAYALAGAITLGALGALYGVAWRTVRRRWCAAFAVAFLLVALIYALEPFTLPVGDRPNPFTALLVLPALILLAEGTIDSVALPGRFARWLRAATICAALSTLAAVLAGALTRLGAAAAISGYLGVIALVELWAARREPRSGHGLVSLSMMLIPALVLAAWRGGLPPSLLRYALIMPLLITGMTRLATGLVRAQRLANEELRRAEEAEAQLRGLNESLERRVALRTAELHELVSWLEGFNRQVSHDLSGPLGGIAGASRLADEALQRGETETAARMLTAITGQAESSVQLVAKLLALARVGNAPFVLKRFALETVVQEALAQLRLADPQGSAVPVTVVGPLPEVEADPDLLRQVYVNLMGNAMKFSSEMDTPCIEVGVLTGNGERTFYVRDNGIGFEPGRARELFEPFRRLHDARFPGHGVGLSIVKQIVQRHSGRVWAEAAPGQGATFLFTLGETAVV
jgi:signal transduction histidine kinase